MVRKQTNVDQMVDYIISNCDDADVLTAVGDETFESLIKDYLCDKYEVLFAGDESSRSSEGNLLMKVSPELVKFWKLIYDNREKTTQSCTHRLAVIAARFADTIGFLRFVKANKRSYHVFDRYSTYKNIAIVGKDNGGVVLMTKTDLILAEDRHKMFLKRYDFTDELIWTVTKKIQTIVKTAVMGPEIFSDSRLIIKHALKLVSDALKEDDVDIRRYIEIIGHEFEEYDYLVRLAI